MKIALLGDIMPGGILPYLKSERLDSGVKMFLKGHDLRVGTLECAIGDDISFDEAKMHDRMNIIYAPESSSRLLTEMDVNVVSLANNHIFDLGVNGFENTVNILHKYGIKHCGAGRNLDEARRAAIIELNGVKIAFLSYCSYDRAQVAYVPVATHDSYGVAPLEIDMAIEDIALYKKQNCIVIVLPHWGKEYSNFPLIESYDIAKKMIDAGADMVVGCHTHRPQPHIKYNGKSIYFSLGNGLFPDFFINAPRPIWYPDKTCDIDALPVTNGYPFPVTTPLKRVWKDFSREGLIVTAHTNKDRIIDNYRFIKLSHGNKLKFHSNYSLSLKLKVIGWLIPTSIYKEGRYYNGLKNKIKSLLNFKLKD